MDNISIILNSDIENDDIIEDDDECISGQKCSTCIRGCCIYDEDEEE